MSNSTNKTSALLYDYHEENTGGYGPPGLEDNLYTSIITGEDGVQWFRYNVPLTPTRWGVTDLGGGSLNDIDLSSVYIGIEVYAINWNSRPQNLWIRALVDNLTIEYKPIPVVVIVNPNTINMKSKGKEMSVTVFVDIPFADVDPNSLTLNGVPATVAMTDDSGKLKIKFDRQEIIKIISPPSATLTLKGLTIDGIPIIGSDTIKVINP